METAIIEISARSHGIPRCHKGSPRLFPLNLAGKTRTNWPTVHWNSKVVTRRRRLLCFFFFFLFCFFFFRLEHPSMIRIDFSRTTYVCRFRSNENQIMYLVFLDETHEGRPLYLDRLAVSVVQSDHEMKEVALPQVARRLLLKVRSAHANPEIHKRCELYYTWTWTWRRLQIDKLSTEDARSFTMNCTHLCELIQTLGYCRRSLHVARIELKVRPNVIDINCSKLHVGSDASEF